MSEVQGGAGQQPQVEEVAEVGWVVVFLHHSSIALSEMHNLEAHGEFPSQKEGGQEGRHLHQEGCS